jgi:hypothetical protein
MSKIVSWMCLVWNALCFLVGVPMVAVTAIGSFSTSTAPWVVVVMALIFLGGPGLGIATALIGARLIKGRTPAVQVASAFD